jgi:DNA-binding NarL/FixJ family response regulator
MRYPQVLVYDGDGRMTEMVRHLRGADKRCRFALREPRSSEACLRLLKHGAPSVLVLRTGMDLVREMTLLERVSWLHPETAVIAVGDAENPALAELAWDLGASCVLLPPLPRDWLTEIVESYLLRPAALGKHTPSESSSDLVMLPESEGG